MGNARALALCHHALGAVRYLRGEWPLAEADLARSVELARSFGGAFGEVLGEQRLALLETGLGRFDEAHERLQRILAVALDSDDPMVRYHGIGRIVTTLAMNRLDAGDLPSATEHVARAFAFREELGACTSCDVLLYPAAVPVYIAHGDLDLAAEGCRQADESAAAFGSTAWVASARYLLGLLDAASGRPDAAASRLGQAAEMYETIGQPYETARALEALAAVAEGADASRHRERAIEIYRRLGAEGALKRLGAPARTAGG